MECFGLSCTFGKARRCCTQYVHGCSGEFPQMMRNFPAPARRMISFAGMCYNRLHSDTIAVDDVFLLAGVVIAVVAAVFSFELRVVRARVAA